MPPPPGGPMGKDLTYAQFHVQREGKAEVIRLDRGTVVSTSESSITVKENDGSEVTVAVNGETKVLAGPGRNTSVTDLKAGQEVIVCGPEGEAAKAIMLPPPPPGGQSGGPQGGPEAGRRAKATSHPWHGGSGRRERPPCRLPAGAPERLGAMKGAILVVEDEQAIADLVRAYLRRDGFEVVWASSGEQALEELARHPVRLVVLDIGLPGIDGFEVCRRLRARTGVPILVLSARDDEVDRVAGLEAGADDYVTKPFSPRELAARVKAILRRASGAGEAVDGGTLSVGDVELERASRTVTVGGEPVELTAREFDLLAALLSHPGVVLSRDRLLELVWGGEFAGGTRTVDVHVAQLRAKLGRPELVQTVRGAGYKAVP